MIPHPTDSELEAFRRRSSSPAELIEIDGHLGQCAECLARLASQADVERSLARLQNEIGNSLRPAHLSEEKVVAVAQGGEDPEAAEHLRTCAACRAEVEDLRNFAATQRRPKSYRAWAIAAAVFVGVLAPLLWMWMQRNQSPSLAAGLRDAGGFVALDAKGELLTRASFPPEYSRIVGQSLRAGRLDVGGASASLGRRQEVLLGSAPEQEGFALQHPIAEAVLSDHPVFSWQALPGASGYRVFVYDEAFHEVVKSPTLSNTVWTTNEPLPRAHVYSWAVSAQVASREIRVPAPPAPEAKFAVISSADAQRLDEARHGFPDAHLLLAALYAQAGVLDQARAQLKALAAANPGSPIVSGLEKSLDVTP